mgnify:CR=1 FL=1|tara:strand:+ start:905 stop:1084 length:180 start_codon:yes stop_codon:yes gene_type:complete
MSKIVFTMSSQGEFSNAYDTDAIQVRNRCAALLTMHRVDAESAAAVEAYVTVLAAAVGA